MNFLNELQNSEQGKSILAAAEKQCESLGPNVGAVILDNARNFRRFYEHQTALSIYMS
jgi:uncharacterized protein GlcG (DUF336 family)